MLHELNITRAWNAASDVDSSHSCIICSNVAGLFYDKKINFTFYSVLLWLMLTVLCVPSRCGSKTAGLSGGSGSGTSRWTFARTATCPSSAVSCSLTMTCTRLIPTTTGPTRASLRHRCPPRTSPSSTPWVPSPRSPCSRPPTPSPPWPWPPGWATPRCPACPRQVLTTSATWMGSGHPASTQLCHHRLVLTGLPAHRTAFTGTLATPAWPLSDLNPNSIQHLDTAACRARAPAWTPVNTTADGPKGGP